MSLLSICPFWSFRCLPWPCLCICSHLPSLGTPPRPSSSRSSFSLKRPSSKKLSEILPWSLQPTLLCSNSYYVFGLLAHPALFSNFCCQTQEHSILYLAFSCLIQHHIPTAWTLKLRLNNKWKNEGFIAYSLSLAEDRNCLMLPLPSFQSSK